MLKKAKSWTRLADKLAKTARSEKFFRMLCGELCQKKNAGSPLLWAVTEQAGNSEAAAQTQAWFRSVVKQRKLGKASREIIGIVDGLSLGSAGKLRSNADTALLAVAAAQSLPSIANRCDEGQWHDAVESLGGLVESAIGNRDLSPWVHQMLAVELPLTLANVLPEFDTLEYFGLDAAGRLVESVSSMLDLDGWPHADYLPIFGPLAASWIRCQLMIRNRKYPFSPEAESQISWMVTQLFRLLRRDGTLMLGQADATPITKDVAAQLVKAMTAKKTDREFVKVCRRARPDKVSVDCVRFQEGSMSEWGRSGVFQAKWTRSTPKVAFDFSKRQFRMEVGHSKPLILGSCLPQIAINGMRVESGGDFEVVCCEQNDDVDFVELEMDWADGLRFQRQILLSREEEFLLVADVVLSDQAAEIGYACRWPLANGIETMKESETREIYLKDNKIQALVLPLALPEWQAARSPNHLEVDERGFQLTQQTAGKSLYAPLFIDLSPKRSRQKRTWRQLTVAEELNRVPADVAVAFRVQLGQQQWVIYRSLAAPGNRSFLGENFSGEFFVGQFDKNGEVNALLQIEP